MEYTIMPIDHSIKLAITASIKRFEFKRYDVDPDEIINSLLTDIFADLFPHNPSLVSLDSNVSVRLPVILPSTTTTTTEPEKKPRGRKPKVVEAPPEPQEGIIESTTTTTTEKRKPGPKPKAKPDTPLNLKKLNPTQVKHLNKASPTTDIKQFIDYVNSLTPEVFGQKGFDEHVHDFLNPSDVVEEKNVKNRDCIEVEFNEQTYFIDPETRAVYKPAGEINEKVGYVGALEFADMEMPTNE